MGCLKILQGYVIIPVEYSALCPTRKGLTITPTIRTGPKEEALNNQRKEIIPEKGESIRIFRNAVEYIRKSF